MSYATDQDEVFRLAASYVDRILRGDKPADLPVQAPTKFGTTVNLRTAKALNTAFTRRSRHRKNAILRM
jgi:putative tryptophan/tyrosine transport system substrate-binding protein